MTQFRVNGGNITDKLIDLLAFCSYIDSALRRAT